MKILSGIYVMIMISYNMLSSIVLGTSQLYYINPDRRHLNNNVVASALLENRSEFLQKPAALSVTTNHFQCRPFCECDLILENLKERISRAYDP